LKSWKRVSADTGAPPFFFGAAGCADTVATPPQPSSDKPNTNAEWNFFMGKGAETTS